MSVRLLTAGELLALRFCEVCKSEIPASKRADAKYCGPECIRRAHVASAKAAVLRNPEQVRQNKKAHRLAHPDRSAELVTQRARRTKNIYGTATPVRKGRGKYAAARALGYRSGLEVQVAQQLTDAGVAFVYEPPFIRYQHNQSRRYTPDWLLPNGIYIESKGLFSAADRTKHLLLRQQHPELDIRLLFQNANNKLSKNSKMTYGEWATKNGFPFCHKIIPASWLEEKPKT